ncbi:MAG TPA: hypothetical protein VF815_43350 [Myxococcaceae bacterium]|jgi:hypothetical protein
MNEWGHLEQKNEDKHDTSSRDHILDRPGLVTGAGRDHSTQAIESKHDSSVKHDTAKSAREQVEKTADRIRDELMLTLEELDRRRHQATDVRYQASRHQDLIKGVAVAALVVTGVTVGMAVWRSRYRRHHLAERRMKAVRRAWNHPDRLATRAEQRPFAVELGQKLIMIFGTALATNIAKSSVQSLVPQQRNAQAGVAQK